MPYAIRKSSSKHVINRNTVKELLFMERQRVAKQISTIYFKLAFNCYSNELKMSKYGQKTGEKVTKLPNRLQATNGLEKSQIFAR